MSPIWDSQEPIETTPIPLQGWVRVVLRGTALLVVLVVLVLVSLLLRLIERPFYGAARPLTSVITQSFFRAELAIFGIHCEVHGTPMTHRGAVVSNHSSWLDIFALNAAHKVCFVSKAEVAGWPVIGFLASMVGTVFIRRDPREARGQTDVFRERLLLGHKLLFFPEGTSTDNFRVLPFKTTLFEAFLTPNLKDKIWIQPATVIYYAPPGADPRMYGWWGAMYFGPHMLHTLAAPKQGVVVVKFHQPIKVCDFDNRKALAAAVEAAVRAGMPPERRGSR